ncbi:MAG: sodium:proton antiporter [Clostridium sp.]
MILAAAFLSFKTTDGKSAGRTTLPGELSRRLQFCFIGIFITMQPALHAFKGKWRKPGIKQSRLQMFWATGCLSSFLG